MKKTSTRAPARRKSFLNRHPGILYFFLSFLLCLVVLGGAAAFLLRSLSEPASEQVSDFSQTPVSSTAAAVASSQQSNADTTNLFTVLLDSSGSPVQFSVVRLDGDNKRIAFLVVPSDLSINLGSSKVPLSRYYKIKGLSATRSALTDLTSISLSYTLVLTQKQVISAVNGFGKVVCVLPYAVSYTGSDDKAVSLNSGSHTLSGKDFFAALAASNYSSAQRYTAQTSLLQAFLGQKLRNLYLDDAEDYFGPYLGKNGSSFQLDTLTTRLDTLRTIISQTNGSYIVSADADVVNETVNSQPLSTFDPDTSSVFYTYFGAR
jgi:hypothetical protein